METGCRPSSPATRTRPAGDQRVRRPRAAGAAKIVGVDVVPSRLALAAELGATHTIDAREEDVAGRIGEITGSGVYYALQQSALGSGLEPFADGYIAFEAFKLLCARERLHAFVLRHLSTKT
jgi:Zinc-binding dehydrogenase